MASSDWKRYSIRLSWSEVQLLEQRAESLCLRPSTLIGKVVREHLKSQYEGVSSAGQ